MKKIILPIIILSLLFGAGPIGILSGSYGVKVLAQEIKLPDPGLTPDSPLYFLDTLGEKIGMFFAFGAEKKAEKAMQYAEEKLAEVKAVAEKNKIKALEKANKKYEEYLDLANEKVKKAKEKGRDVEKLATLITEKTLKHQEILLGVFEKVPEEAKTAIEQAIEVSKKGSEEAVKAVTGTKKEELVQKAEEIKAKIEEGIEKEDLEEKKVEGEISCKDNFDCPTQMKCENSVCVDVGCIEEGEMSPSAGINPQWLEHLPTECCEGLKSIAYSGNFDENCKFMPPPGAPTGLCSKCGNGICEEWETKCNCPEDCKERCLREGETYMPGEDGQCCAGLEKMTITYGDGTICTLPMGYVCTAFCGDGKCQGEYENACSCSEDCLWPVPNTPTMLDIDVSTTAGTPYTIGWRAVSEATNYILERDTDSSFSNPIIVSSRTLNSFSGILSPSVSSRYYFRVKACNKYGCSSWSKTTELWVEACPLPEAPVLTDPGISVKSDESFGLSWTCCIGGALQRDTDPTFPNPSQVYAGQSLSPAKTATYYYRVNACNDCGCSSWSNVVDMQVIVPSITVISPNGGESLGVGKTYLIQWRSDNLPTGNNIDIELIGVTETGNTVRKTLFSSLPNNSTNVNWLVPVDIKGRYRIRVISYAFACGGNQSTCLDDSDAPFSIVQPSVTVTSPNGGEVWETGETRRITWDSVGVDSVHIYITDPSILGSGSTNYITPDGVPVPAEAGYYNWTIPVFHGLPGSGVDNFKIRIFDASNATIKDYSDDFFSIMPNPPLTLISPNGGEILEKGKTYTIRWDGSSFYGGYGGVSIQINLIDGSVSPKEWMAIIKTTNTGGYTWTVPGTIKSGSLFKMEIYVDEAGPGKYDLSDNTFTILPSSPPKP